MTDLYLEPAEAKSRWYQRRGPQVAVASGVTAVLALTGIGINAAAGTQTDPAAAVEEAAANLKELPASVTITGGAQNPGEVTLTRTDAGTQISLQSDELGGTIDVALIGETLFLRLNSDQLSGFAANPFLSLAKLQYPSIGALLNGQWVSLDVSDNSEVLAALRESQGSQASDPGSLRSAADELHTSLDSVGEDVRQPLVDALKGNASVVAVDDSSGPEGSEHYQVTVDADQVKQDLTPVLQGAFDQVLAALDTFAAEVGDQLPGGGADWETNRAKLVDGFNNALAKDAQAAPAIDVWIAEGVFTQISTAKATLTFNSDPTLDAPQTAVSMDDDLINALPLIEQYGGALMGGGQQGLGGGGLDLKGLAGLAG